MIYVAAFILVVPLTIAVASMLTAPSAALRRPAVSRVAALAYAGRITIESAGALRRSTRRAALRTVVDELHAALRGARAIATWRRAAEPRRTLGAGALLALLRIWPAAVTIVLALAPRRSAVAWLFALEDALLTELSEAVMDLPSSIEEQALGRVRASRSRREAT